MFFYRLWCFVLSLLLVGAFFERCCSLSNAFERFRKSEEVGESQRRLENGQRKARESSRKLEEVPRAKLQNFITLLSFDLQRNYYIKNLVLFEENPILPLPECLEASGVESVWGEVSQESPKNR